MIRGLLACLFSAFPPLLFGGRRGRVVGLGKQPRLRAGEQEGGRSWAGKCRGKGKGKEIRGRARAARFEGGWQTVREPRGGMESGYFAVRNRVGEMDAAIEEGRKEAGRYISNPRFCR